MTPPLHEQIRAARINAGLTQKAVAERLGTSQQNIQQIEKERRSVALNTLQKLANLYGCDFTVYADKK